MLDFLILVCRSRRGLGGVLGRCSRRHDKVSSLVHCRVLRRCQRQPQRSGTLMSVQTLFAYCLRSILLCAQVLDGQALGQLAVQRPLPFRHPLGACWGRLARAPHFSTFHGDRLHLPSTLRPHRHCQCQCHRWRRPRCSCRNSTRAVASAPRHRTTRTFTRLRARQRAQRSLLRSTGRLEARWLASTAAPNCCRPLTRRRGATAAATVLLAPRILRWHLQPRLRRLLLLQPA